MKACSRELLVLPQSVFNILKLCKSLAKLFVNFLTLLFFYLKSAGIQLKKRFHFNFLIFIFILYDRFFLFFCLDLWFYQIIRYALYGGAGDTLLILIIYTLAQGVIIKILIFLLLNYLLFWNTFGQNLGF